MNSINEKDPARAAQLERVITEALDRVQRAWLTQGESSNAKMPSIENHLHSSSHHSIPFRFWIYTIEYFSCIYYF